MTLTRRLAALEAARTTAARAESDRLHAALVALIEPATPPAGVVRAAGVIAETGEFGLAPGTPPYLVLEALAAHFRQPDD